MKFLIAVGPTRPAVGPICPAVGPTRPATHQVQKVISPGVKRSGREADHSHIIKVQRDATISGLYFILLQYPSTCFGCLLHPSSGAHKTLVTTTGTGHVSR
jgi:hypothetical protein